MFTSKQFLSAQLGIDEEIAAFFVDRKVPVDNLYWKERLLYVSHGTGYMFIPIFFDLQYKAGMDKKMLLSNEYVLLMEAILNSAAQHEFAQQDFAGHLENCNRLMNDKVKNQSLYNDLLHYFGNNNLMPHKYLGTPSKALNRADTLLFLLCSQAMEESIVKQVIKNWYALVPSFLLMDDVMDLQEDQDKGEENSIADFGEGKQGVKNAIQYLEQNFLQLKAVNQKLGTYFEASLQKKLATPYLQSLLNR